MGRFDCISKFTGFFSIQVEYISKVPELCFLIQLMNVFEFLNLVDHFHTKVNFQMN